MTRKEPDMTKQTNTLNRFLRSLALGRNDLKPGAATALHSAIRQPSVSQTFIT
jgi:hypothetical protein